MMTNGSNTGIASRHVNLSWNLVYRIFLVIGMRET
jgi:hypothetical protein